MNKFILLLLALAALLSLGEGHDLTVGTTYNNHLIWQNKAEYNAIPFKKRVKEVFYSDPQQRIIKSVIARDLDHSEASATISSGGIGFTYVDLRLKSARGAGLNYNIEIYA